MPGDRRCGSIARENDDCPRAIRGVAFAARQVHDLRDGSLDWLRRVAESRLAPGGLATNDRPLSAQSRRRPVMPPEISSLELL